MEDGEHGYSITEILVALVLLTLILGFVSSSYLFTWRIFSKWKHEILLTESHQLVMETVRKELFSTDQIQTNDGKLMVAKHQKKNQYELQKQMINKNGFPLLSAPYKVLQFKLASNKEVADITKQTKKPLLLSVSITVADEQDSLQSTITFSGRQPAYWSPMK